MRCKSMERFVKDAVYHINELSDKCRTCLKSCSQTNSKDLFGKHNVSKTKVTVAEILMTCTSIKIARDDGFPSQICCECLRIASKFFSFKIRSQEVNAFMIGLAEKSEPIATKKEDDTFDSNSFVPSDDEKVIVPKHEKTELQDYNESNDSKLFENGTNGHDYSDSDDDDKKECGECHKKIRAGFMTRHMRTHKTGKSCEFCGALFSSRKSLAKHLTKVHGTNVKSEAKYKCDTCGKTFALVKSLEKHCQRHYDKKFECAECAKMFYTHEALVSHKQYTHAAKKYVCTDCNKAYTMLFHLKRHQTKCQKGTSTVKTESGEPRQHWTCEVCNKLFLYRSRYDSHMIQEHQDMIDTSDRKLFTCEQCGKSFPTYAMHYAHVHRKHGEKKHLCTDCGKGFTYAVQLKRHRLMHTGEKMFKCNICAKEYKYDNMFAAHMRSHTGDRPYKCNICDKGFNQSGHLAVHILRHKGIKEHECHLCGKRFTEKGGLTAHSKIHSGETRYPCPVCSKAFYFLKSMRKHMESHQR